MQVRKAGRGHAMLGERKKGLVKKGVMVKEKTRLYNILESQGKGDVGRCLFGEGYMKGGKKNGENVKKTEDRGKTTGKFEKKISLKRKKKGKKILED